MKSNTTERKIYTKLPSIYFPLSIYTLAIIHILKKIKNYSISRIIERSNAAKSYVTKNLKRLLLFFLLT